jgi:hypothetical protein
LQVKGNQLLEDGKPIKLHGINYFGFNNQQVGCALQLQWIQVDTAWTGHDPHAWHPYFSECALCRAFAS